MCILVGQSGIRILRRCVISPFPEVGVTFCGNPLIGTALEEACAKHTSISRGGVKFALHSEVF